MAARKCANGGWPKDLITVLFWFSDQRCETTIENTNVREIRHLEVSRVREPEMALSEAPSGSDRSQERTYDIV